MMFEGVDFERNCARVLYVYVSASMLTIYVTHLATSDTKSPAFESQFWPRPNVQTCYHDVPYIKFNCEDVVVIVWTSQAAGNRLFRWTEISSVSP